MPATLTNPKFRATYSDGRPLAGGKVYFYETGTTTVKDVYYNKELTEEASSPVILNEYGEALIYINGNYDVLVHDKNDNVIHSTVTNIKDRDLTVGEFSFTTDGSNIGYFEVSTGLGTNDLDYGCAIKVDSAVFLTSIHKVYASTGTQSDYTYKKICGNATSTATVYAPTDTGNIMFTFDTSTQTTFFVKWWARTR